MGDTGARARIRWAAPMQDSARARGQVSSARLRAQAGPQAWACASCCGCATVRLVGCASLVQRSTRVPSPHCHPSHCAPPNSSAGSRPPPTPTPTPSPGILRREEVCPTTHGRSSQGTADSLRGWGMHWWRSAWGHLWYVWALRCTCMRMRMRASLHARECVHACVRVCGRARVRVCVHASDASVCMCPSPVQPCARTHSRLRPCERACVPSRYCAAITHAQVEAQVMNRACIRAGQPTDSRC